MMKSVAINGFSDVVTLTHIHNPIHTHTHTHIWKSIHANFVYTKKDDINKKISIISAVFLQHNIR